MADYTSDLRSRVLRRLAHRNDKRKPAKLLRSDASGTQKLLNDVDARTRPAGEVDPAMLGPATRSTFAAEGLPLTRAGTRQLRQRNRAR